LRNWQLTLTIVALLGVLLGMNYAADWRKDQAEARGKEVQKLREAAEAAAQAANNPGVPAGHGGDEKAFALPANSGPLDAPVKLQIFANDANSCHQTSTTLKEVEGVYGALLRVEWLSMTDPKAAEQSDKLSIGCEAGLAINGQIEREIARQGGKTLVSFRGPLGDKYRLPDVYAGINAALTEKGKQPPAAAVTKAKG
jgi:hypothetical protein